MKRSAKVFIALIIFAILYYNPAFGVQNKNIVCTYSDNSQTLINYIIPEYKINTTSINGTSYKKFVIEDEGTISVIGKPDLPVISRIIAVPFGAEISLEFENTEEKIIKNVIPYPYQDQLNDKSEFKLDTSLYKGKNKFPQKQLEISSKAILRDFNLVNVSIYPCQYNTNNKSVKVLTKAKIKINYGNCKNGFNRKGQLISRSFEPLYRSNILNYISIPKGRTQLPSYLFIYPDDSYVEAYLSYLTAWKHKKGFVVNTASTATTGTGATSIKDYIENAYYNWDNPPEFVCLVGDAGGNYSIPTAHQGGGEGDQYYGLLEGNDLLADVMIGRLSFNSLIEFQTIINKILSYEQDPYMDDTHWITRSLLVGDPSTSGPSCVIVNKYIKEMTKDNMSYYTFDEVYNSPFVSGISSGINNGVSFFNYRGWYGMSGWGVGDINNLNNGYMLPFGVISTCGTGGFEGTSDCISEAFTKAGSPSTPRGTIGTVGTATLDTHTTFNNALCAGIAKSIYQDRMFYLGGALNGGKINLWRCFPADPNNWVTNFSYWNNLMGDPGLEIWTNIPNEFQVIHEAQIPQGTNYYNIQVNNQYGNSIREAMVCILRDDTIFEVGYTDENGQIQMPISGAGNGQVNLTVTKHNFIPYQSTFSIIQLNQFACLDSYTIDDDNTGSSNGNNNSQVNPGEIIEMPVTLTNSGNVPLTNVTANLSSNSDLVNITDHREIFGDIAPGENVTSFDDFDFEVSTSSVNGDEIVFLLEIDDGQGNLWQEYIKLSISSADLVYSSYEIIDANNGILDPGETADLKIAVENEGLETAQNVSGILHAASDNFILHDSTGYFGDIFSGQIVTNDSDIFVIEANSDLISGTTYYLDLELEGDNDFSVNIACRIVVGQTQTGDPLPPDAYGYYCYDSGDVNYSIAPTYNWIEIDPDLGGDGIELNLYDNGDTGDITDINLPFNFKMYGITYTTLTICSNGWVAPGQTEQYSFMNAPIPGALGPTPMIAGFWDDLKTGNGNVCYYFDSAEHRLIIEWSQLTNDYNNAPETFQVILYDQNFYPTPTGDGNIVVQFKEVNNVDAGSYGGGYVEHGEYATVGIENHNGSIGVEYTFSNQYPAGAQILQDEMAILFTTNGSQVLDPPVANIEPLSFDFELEPGTTTTDILSLENNGPSNLYFTVTKDYLDSDGSGGPDSYGYVWTDSDEINGPEYNWIDISSNCTQLNFDHNDHSAPPIDIGFDFEFYGEIYDELIVNPNGWIGFGDDWTDYHNYSIPRQDAPKPAIFGFWDDLDPLQGGDVYYYTNNEDMLVVWYDDVIHYPGNWNGTYDFEIILKADGTIKIQYRDVSGDVDSSTLGIQNANGNIGLQISYNEIYAHDELAVEITRFIDWLTLDITSGIIFPGESEEIELTVDTEELDVNSNYLSYLDVSTNDPNLSFVQIPVNLSVLNGPAGNLAGQVSLIGGSANVENVLIEAGSYSTNPNYSGYYDLELPAGTYDMAVSLNGYDSFYQQIEIVVDEITTVNPVLQYIKPPDNIEVEITELFNALISWSSVNNYNPNKLFQSYFLYRKYNEQNWNLIQDNIIDTVYTDTLYDEPDGNYRYAVKAVYENSSSDMKISDVLTINRFTDVSFDITLSDGSTPDGIHILMTGLDSVYQQTFLDSTDASGVLQFNNVYNADYELEISKTNYETIAETINVDSQNNQFSYMLQYIQSIEQFDQKQKFQLAQNHPNPVFSNHSTHISYNVPHASQIVLTVYNIKGEKLSKLVDQFYEKGSYNVVWDLKTDNGKRVGAGIYFYKLTTDNKTIDVKKCLVF